MDGVTEEARFFGREGNLLGITSEPEGGPTRSPAVVILNAGIIHRMGPSRFAVELARGLSSEGYRVLRFDLSGIGDSPRSTRPGTLQEIVHQDISDAVQLVTAGKARSESDEVSSGTGGESGQALEPKRLGETALLGLCSGADHSFQFSLSDERVTGLALIDPTIHPTPGYYARRIARRLLSPKSWWNVLSGRSLRLRLEARPRIRSASEASRSSEAGDSLNPASYAEHVDPPEQARRKARALEAQGTRLLYVITRGGHGECNHPDQVAASLDLEPDSPVLQVEWRPEADHTLTRAADRRWLLQTMLDWLPGASDHSRDESPGDSPSRLETSSAS